MTNLPPYPAYRDSGVPWLGKISWQWKQMPRWASSVDVIVVSVIRQFSWMQRQSHATIVHMCVDHARSTPRWGRKDYNGFRKHRIQRRLRQAVALSVPFSIRCSAFVSTSTHPNREGAT
jgi:hypothetical protein